MSTALSRSLRIAVLASSVGYYVRPPDGQARPYPEVVEETLRSSGIDAEVVNHASWFVLIHEAFRQIQAMVVPRGADVAVVNFGILECEPTVLPTRLVRSVYYGAPSSNRWMRRVRRLLVTPVHQFHVRLGPVVLKRVRAFHRLSPARFEAELTRMVRWIRKERGALVLVMNINPAGDNVEKTIPGTQESVRRYNEIIERVVHSMGDDGVRLVDVAAAVEDARDDLVPDGIHYSAKGHRLVAGMLVEEIERWRSLA